MKHRMNQEAELVKLIQSIRSDNYINTGQKRTLLLCEDVNEVSYNAWTDSATRFVAPHQQQTLCSWGSIKVMQRGYWWAWDDTKFNLLTNIPHVVKHKSPVGLNSTSNSGCADIALNMLHDWSLRQGRELAIETEVECFKGKTFASSFGIMHKLSRYVIEHLPIAGFIQYEHLTEFVELYPPS